MYTNNKGTDQPPVAHVSVSTRFDLSSWEFPNFQLLLLIYLDLFHPLPGLLLLADC